MTPPLNLQMKIHKQLLGTYIFHHRHFPALWKIAKIVPVPKPGKNPKLLQPIPQPDLPLEHDQQNPRIPNP